MRQYTITPLVLAGLMLTLMVGCTGFPKNTHEQSVASQHEALKRTTTPRPVRVVQGSYLGATPVKIPKRTSLPPVFQTPVTLTASGTLTEFAQRISSMLPVRIQIWNEPTIKTQGKDSASQVIRASLKYTGLLRGLLDTLAARFNMGWEYNLNTGLVTFSRFRTRMFTLHAPPGKIGFEGTITNKSQTSQNSSSSSATTQTVSNADMGSETSQSSFNSFEIDVWSEVGRAISSMLSDGGKAVVTPSSGTLTVTDTIQVLDSVAAHIETLNAKMSRQVALSVKVWALQLTEDSGAGFDLEKILMGSAVSLTSAGASPFRTLDGVGSVSATILSDKLKGSSGVLQALQEFGRTTLVTSGSGISMNNMPLPVQVITREAYLAGISTTTDEYSQTTELTPGEVATGFSMVVIPHILDRREVILQYNVTFSSLDELEEFSSGDVTVQLPKVSTRSFSQRVTMHIGQTLVLGGFEQEQRFDSKGIGLIAGGKSGQYGKSVIVITIDVADAEV